MWRSSRWTGSPACRWRTWVIRRRCGQGSGSARSAIPLAYEHTVTVGVVSYVGRKLFDESLDDYIQTDAAIDFGNSGGPLINAAGAVVGINSAVSSEGNNIGFAVPINQAREILAQLRKRGRVVRGYIGVNLHDLDEDLQRSLRLGTARGVLIEDVTPGSPAERAGLRRYDVVTAVEGRGIQGTAELIRDIAAREPGTRVAVQLVREGREQDVEVQLAERPPREEAEPATPPAGGPVERRRAAASASASRISPGRSGPAGSCPRRCPA